MFPEVSVEYVCCDLCGTDDMPLLFRVSTPSVTAMSSGAASGTVYGCLQGSLCRVTPVRKGVHRRRVSLSKTEWTGDSHRHGVRERMAADLQTAISWRFVRTLYRYLPEGQLLDFEVEWLVSRCRSVVSTAWRRLM